MHLFSTNLLSSFSVYPNFSLKEKISFALDQHKKILIVAAIALGFLAACYAVYRFCWASKKQVLLIEKQNPFPIEVPSKGDKEDQKGILSRDELEDMRAEQPEDVKETIIPEEESSHALGSPTGNIIVSNEVILDEEYLSDSESTEVQLADKVSKSEERRGSQITEKKVEAGSKELLKSEEQVVSGEKINDSNKPIEAAAEPKNSTESQGEESEAKTKLEKKSPEEATSDLVNENESGKDVVLEEDASASLTIETSPQETISDKITTPAKSADQAGEENQATSENKGSKEGPTTAGIQEKIKKFQSIKTVTYRYSGTVKEGKFKGKTSILLEGSVSYANGLTLKGKFKNNKLNGPEGKLLHIKEGKEQIFEGEFKDNQLHGQGKKKFFDGMIEEGTFRMGRLHGLGKRIYPNGIEMEGEFRNNALNGQAKVIYPGKGYCEGIYKDHKLNGLGKKVYLDGKKMEGEFINGKLNGQGTVTYPDARVESGIYKDDILVTPSPQSIG